MAKKITLSQELIKGLALLAGGGSPQQLIDNIQWRHRTSQDPWLPILSQILQEAQRLGASCIDLLRDLARFIREDEKWHRKLATLEQQFAFQGAVLFVLPWGVLSLTHHFTLNLFIIIGATLQLVGLGCLVLCIKKIKKADQEEPSWLRQFSLTLWLHLRTGCNPYQALEFAIQGASNSKFQIIWKNWLQMLNSSLNTEVFQWPRSMPESHQLAEMLTPLLKQGAPLTEFLAQYIDQLEAERMGFLDQKMSTLPNKLALIFSFSFAPGFLLLLVGSLWDQIKDLLM